MTTTLHSVINNLLKTNVEQNTVHQPKNIFKRNAEYTNWFLLNE